MKQESHETHEPHEPRLCRVGSVGIGGGRPLCIIAGPCVLESLEQSLAIARHVKALCVRLGLSYVFKGSFDKANRSSINSARGPGIERGFEWLRAVRQEVGVPVTTDIHEPNQAEPAASSVDLIQIPAFLCRQTDLLLAAGRAAAERGPNKGVNVKKGQFMAPSEVSGAVKKLREAGASNVMVTERGTFFGYHRLVNDFVGLEDLIRGVGEGAGEKLEASLYGDGVAPPPVCFDATHSTQRPGLGEVTGGRPERAAGLARAAVALGVHALFLECHPEPTKALSDRATVQPLEAMEGILKQCAAIRAALANYDGASQRFGQAGPSGPGSGGLR